MSNRIAFPWGVYLGDFLNAQEARIPVCLDSQRGGFCVRFDEDSQDIAYRLIENVVLKLFEVLPHGNISSTIFDFSHKKRFPYLATLQSDQRYQIALNENQADNLFSELERLAIHRHHHLLSAKITHLSQYNAQNPQFIEKYHIVLINLEHYPNSMASYKRIKEWIDSAFEVGFYLIAFVDQAQIPAENKAVQAILSKFPALEIQQQRVMLNQNLFELYDLANGYEFEYVNDNRDLILEKLANQSKAKQQESTAQDFLSIPIGTTSDGRRIIHFSLGDHSKAYHAFITGVAGSGKTTLLNNLILQIAERHTSQEVRLYLMDYKEGVEFQVFQQHPNCEKIFLDNEDLAAAVHLLETFVQQIQQRAELFKQSAVKDIVHYHQQNPPQPLPHLILVIDEVHRLFAGNYQQKERFSALLKQVVRQGRAFGIHILLSTQTLAGTQIDRELMSQITLRISFKLTDSRDAEAIFTYGNTEAVNLAPHELIYNQDAGNKNANVRCRAYPPADIKATLQKVMASRDPALILVPELIKTPTRAGAGANMAPPATPAPPAPKPVYGTDSEKALLNQLIQAGKITPPQGFKPAPTDKTQD